MLIPAFLYGGKMEFYAPKDFKSGRLINSRYRKIDIVIMVTGILISTAFIVGYMGMLDGRNWILFLFLCLPAMTGMFLTMPAGLDHNMLELLKMLFVYWKSEKDYFWEGIYKEDVRE